jgi:hypothetical protein
MRARFNDHIARFLALSTMFLLLCIACAAQSDVPKLEPGTTNIAVPSVSFELEWPGTDPPHYSISIDSTGRAAYTSSPPSTESTGAPYELKWTATDATRTRVFELARKAHFFQGKVDSGDKRIAYTGTKTLTYIEGPQDGTMPPTSGAYHQASYNWSSNPTVQELTKLFEEISTTIELGRKLQHDARFDRLSLDEDLRRMDELQQEKGLAEVGAIKPVLQQIVQDPQVMDIARERAKRLLETGG